MMINHNVPDTTLSRFKTAIVKIISEENKSDNPLLAPDDPKLLRHPLWIATNAVMVANDPSISMEKSKELIDEAVDDIQQAGFPSGERYIRMAQQLFDACKGESSGNPVSMEIFNHSLESTDEEDFLSKTFKGLVSKIRLVFCHPKKVEYRNWRDYGQGDIKFGTVNWRLPSQSKIVVLADWGTGTREALDVLKAAVAMRPDAIIHLGDIYDTGSEEECEQKFAKPMRKYAPGIPVYTLAGNHDYYCGGEGFYKLIDGLNPQDRRQNASYFCLRSENNEWQFLAMDTGRDSFRDKGESHRRGPGLHPDEVLWLRDKLTVFPGKTILLSHHQPFSNIDRMYGDEDDPEADMADRINKRLINAVGDYMENVAIWKCGHDHDLVIYHDVNTLAKHPVRLRCVGNSAKSDSVKKVTREREERENNKPEFDYLRNVMPSKTRNGKDYNKCFELVELDDNHATVGYYEVTEDRETRLLYREHI